jgi:hypothetical protein
LKHRNYARAGLRGRALVAAALTCRVSRQGSLRSEAESSCPARCRSRSAVTRPYPPLLVGCKAQHSYSTRPCSTKHGYAGVTTIGVRSSTSRSGYVASGSWRQTPLRAEPDRASFRRARSGARLQGGGEGRRRSHRHVGDGRGCRYTKYTRRQPTARAFPRRFIWTDQPEAILRSGRDDSPAFALRRKTFHAPLEASAPGIFGPARTVENTRSGLSGRP